jgi:hypothetical protein
MGPFLTQHTHKEIDMSNPYELRFSMLMEAKTTLVDEYHAKSQQLLDKYYALKDSGESIEFPDLPKYPTFEDIENLCTKINAFVSTK